jgi:hypothetical protein
MSTTAPAEILAQMAPAARVKFAAEGDWARASGLPKETLSRLKRKASCDWRTLAALAASAGYRLAAVPARGPSKGHLPARFGRDDEDRLLDLAASGNVDPEVWRAEGPGFFMGGLAVMLASARGFERERYLRLAEALHPGVSTPEVFALWLERTPLRPSRFLPMARRRRDRAPA